MKIKYLHFFFKKKNKPPRISLCLILISLFFSAKISAQFAIPLTTGSFTKDVIAENSLGSAYSSAVMDLSNNVFYSSTFPSSSNGISSTSYSYGTHPYVLQPFNGNNVNQILPNGADAILTLQAPTQLTNVFLLVTSTEQISYVDVTVNFTDATSQLITSTSISDWALGSGGQIFSGIVNRGANTFVYPRKVFEIGGSITTLNQNKYVQSIRVKRTGGSTANSRVHIFGASSCSLPVITQCLGNISEACAGVVNYTVAASGATSLSYTKSGATSGSGSGTGSGTSFNFGTTNVIVTATNSCGSVSCSFPVIIVDNQPPAITCPQYILVNADNDQCGAKVTFSTPTATDNCAPGDIVGFQTLGTIGNHKYYLSSLTTKIWTEAQADAVDKGGHLVTITSSAENALVTIPTGPRNFIGLTDIPQVGNFEWITGEPVSYTNWSPGEPNTIGVERYVEMLTGSGTWNNVAASTFFDNRYILEVEGAFIKQTAGLTSGSTFPIGTTDNFFTATDASGNTSSCSVTVTVIDNQNPVIACPAPLSINSTPGTCGAVATFSTPTATDNCSATVSLTSGLASGSTFQVGTTTNVFTAIDPSNNSAQCSFTVTVNDTENPTVTCPMPISVGNTPGNCSAVVNFTVSASDNCSFTSNLTGLSSGSTFPVGTTTNVFTATDPAGNASSCSFTVTVNDTEKPTVTCPAPIAVNNTVGLCSAVVYFTVSATDNCAFTANLAGLASGSTFPVGTTTNVFTATDAAGNTALCSFTVTVTDNQKPVITCPTPLSINNTAGTCGAVAMFSVTATDNCSATVSKTSGLASGSTFPVGTTTNVFTATDAAGNTASCNFTVTVNIFADPTLIHAYTVIGVADVKMKSNTVQSGGVGVVNAGEKAKLEQTTLVTAPYTFVKAPVLDLKSGSTVTTYFPGSVSVGILPTFLSNNSPSNNDVNTANNSTQTLPLSSYGKIEVGKNATVIFTGHAQVLIKEIKLREGASLVFSQNTTLLVDKKMDTDKSAKINIAGLNSVQFFVEEDVKIDQNNIVKANIYTQKNLKVEESKDGSTYMTGLFIADKVDAKDNVIWNRSPNGCANSSSSSSSLASNRTFSFDIHAEPTRVQLNWISNQGQNTDYFTIQKFDKNAGLFSDLEIVNNKFADNEQHYYTTYDNNPTEGDNVYRVQMTMNNNKTQLSELKSITFDGLNSVRLFPNPANDIVDMDLSRYSGSDVSVYLYNSFGKQVHFQLLPKVGKQLITLDLGVFDSGTYLVRFAAKGKRDLTKKLMIVK